jgi:hypothetical protein
MAGASTKRKELGYTELRLKGEVKDVDAGAVRVRRAIGLAWNALVLALPYSISARSRPVCHRFGGRGLSWRWPMRCSLTHQCRRLGEIAVRSEAVELPSGQ